MRLTVLTTIGLLASLAIGRPWVEGTTRAESGEQPVAEQFVSKAPTARSLKDLHSLGPAELDKLDIALVNLLCAEGLPGSDAIRIDDSLGLLDVWAARVKVETERHLYRVKDPRYAEHYHHSEIYLRVELLLQTLQEDVGVRYNPDRIYNPDASDSRDQFIHGAMDSARGGTCASMPVLYAAVGRRLGYPLKLVMARGHLFCRWDDGKGEKLNIEGTNGFTSHPDEFYRKWPGPLSDNELKWREYLVSLTPSEELAIFMAARGHCFMDSYRFPEAAEAYAATVRLAPTFKVQAGFLEAARFGAAKGRAEFERLYGKKPTHVVPPPLPPEITSTPQERR